MTYLYDQPNDFAADAVAGFAAAHPTITQVHGGVVRASATPPGQPALVIGGGTGHYPAFSGWVGPGMAHGSPCGNVFASPSASQVYSVARNAENGGGVVLGFGNYAGDMLHFGLAAEKLRAEGIDVRVVPVSDDVASNDQENRRDRRGIAGDLPVLKAVGAAIENGADLDEAERIATKANEATRSLGVAFDGCTLPGADEPLFRVPEGKLAVGLGIHGEPGVRDEPMGTAADVAALLVDGVLGEEPARTSDGYDGRAAVILNGLGTVKYEEQFVVYNHVARLLAERDIVPVHPEVGEFVSSLDMAGLSLTLVFLDDELERLWTAPIDTPAFHRGIMPDIDRPLRENVWEPGDEPVPDSGEASRQSARKIADVIALFERVCVREEEELGRIDSVAGDGDHGQGMLLGSSGAADAAREAVNQDAGARTVLARSGEAWAESAGGTSGALWGAALDAAG
ncbi:MAG: dihydroxyacetone kinase family protein, partial [Kocuria sp.]|nr:dihydroxyacetone kinase family protein [Kocuria sp.]